MTEPTLIRISEVAVKPLELREGKSGKMLRRNLNMKSETEIRALLGSAVWKGSAINLSRIKCHS
jgi:hypothetical protein